MTAKQVRFFYAAVAAAAMQLTLARAGDAQVYGGGGLPATDCLSVFKADINYPAIRPHAVACTDGDPTCDHDGIVNGVCDIQVQVCVNSTQVIGCSLNGVESITVQHALDNGEPKFDPDFQALQTRIDNTILAQPPNTTADSCTAASDVLVPIIGPFKTRTGDNVCRKNSKTVQLTTVSTLIGGKTYTDRDALGLICVPSTNNGCDPRTLFDGTFDRVQKQIFDESCARSGCHDSQTHQNNLVLEKGASLGNLLNITPTNQAAVGLGWLRVNPGDSANSFLYHKVTGQLPLIQPTPGLGLRMPRKRPKLNPTLIEIIQLWIDAGAPNISCMVDPINCWVTGTD